MSCYVLDTGIMIGLLRGAPYARYVLDEYKPFSAPNITVQSITTLAELEAMGFRRIAATATAMSATLLTTDKDFCPLNDEFLKVVYVDPKMSYSETSR